MQFPFSRPPHGPIIAARTPAIMPDRENEERVRKSNRPCLLLDSVHVEEAPLEFPPKCFALRVIGHSAKEPRKGHFSFGWECCYYQGGRRNTYWGSKQPSCQTTVELAHLKQSLEVSHVVEKSQLIKQWNNLVTVSWLWGSFWLYSALMRNSLGIVGFWTRDCPFLFSSPPQHLTFLPSMHLQLHTPFYFFFLCPSIFCFWPSAFLSRPHMEIPHR